MSLNIFNFIPGSADCFNLDVDSQVGESFLASRNSFVTKTQKIVDSSFSLIKRNPPKHVDRSEWKNQCAQFKEDSTSRESYLFQVNYLEEPGNLAKVLLHLQPGDKLVIHGEGEPFMLGFDEPSSFNLYPHSLAKMLVNAGLPEDKDIEIELLACQSASDYPSPDNGDFNFAKDLSQALSYLGKDGYENITVSGYTGLIEELKGNKFICIADPFPGTDKESEIKGKISSRLKSTLEEAKASFKLGEAINRYRILSDLSRKPFTWAQEKTFGSTNFLEVNKRGMEILAGTEVLDDLKESRFFVGRR
jgi:hypothetical protein